MQKNNLKHFFHLHFLVLIAGFTAILGELITNSSEVIVWHRMLIGSVLLGLYILIDRRSLKIDFKLFLKYSFLGLIISLHWITFFEAIDQSKQKKEKQEKPILIPVLYPLNIQILH